MIVLGVAVAGALGAASRYALDTFVQDRVGGIFPWGTLLINVSGSLLVGFLAGLGLYHGFGTTPRVLIGTGFCGAYTTFSTVSYETARLAEDGARLEAFLNIAGSVALGLGAAVLGLVVAGVAG